jgi:hypothetical protein
MRAVLSKEFPRTQQPVGDLHAMTLLAHAPHPHPGVGDATSDQSVQGIRDKSLPVASEPPRWILAAALGYHGMQYLAEVRRNQPLE